MLRPLLSSYARQENTVKNHCFWQILVLLGLGRRPPPLRIWGALQPGSFYTPYHKTACYGDIFGLFFCQTYCNLSCCKSASKQNRDFMKNAQNHVNCEVKPNFGKKQLEPKSSPIAFSIGFSQSSHTLHVLYQKSSFCVESNKTLQKCSQNPFFWSLKPFKKSPLKRISQSRPQEKER